jgi:hypothetical protein
MSRYKYLYANKWLDTKQISLHSSYYKGETLPNSAVLVDDVCPPMDWHQIVFCNGDANEKGAIINIPRYPADMYAWI